jgi:hypothetical protein
MGGVLRTGLVIPPFGGLSAEFSIARRRGGTVSGSFAMTSARNGTLAREKQTNSWLETPNTTSQTGYRPQADAPPHARPLPRRRLLPFQLEPDDPAVSVADVPPPGGD